MHFKPQEPFAMYKNGSVTWSKIKERRNAQLYCGNNTKKLYLSRYMYMVEHFAKTGEILPSHYDVHHIDDNKNNDSLDNLEAIPHNEHLREHKSTGYILGTLICPVCKVKFKREMACYYTNALAKHTLKFCSLHHRTCFQICNADMSLVPNLMNDQIVDIYKEHTDGRIEYLFTNDSCMLSPEWFLHDKFGNLIDFSLPKYLHTLEKVEKIRLWLSLYPNITYGDISNMLGIGKAAISQLVRAYNIKCY